MERSRGFTLLEMIVVAAIVAIVAAIAVQSYARYTFRARRTDARQVLMAIAQGQERWHATYHRYADDLSELGYPDPAISPHGYYQVVLSAEENGFVATAIPLERQAADLCGSLSIDQAGRKSPDRDDAQANANGRCW